MTEHDTTPVVLPANQPEARFYRGGSQIRAFRGITVAESDFTPEDWVGSTTSVRGEGDTGQTRLNDGQLLRDAIAADPERWLGREHIDRFGVDTKLLVKLLDAGQRLPVHAHPHVGFASEHLGSAHGKAEAWYILTAGTVHLGLVRDVTKAELQALVAAQSVEQLLGLTHTIQVQPGDRVYVPPGVLHAIGEGVLLAEVQEPEDMSILLEWDGFELDGAVDGHLGLGFDLALEAVERHGRTQAEIDELVVRADDPNPGLPAAADPYFRIIRVDVDGAAQIPDGFVILIAVAGTLQLESADGDVPVTAGSTLLLPAASSARTVVGTGQVLVACPPDWR